MGKPGKNTRKFAKKHLKSVIDKRRKYKPLREARKRKKTASQDLQPGLKKVAAESARKDACNLTLKMSSQKMNGIEVMKDDIMDVPGIVDDVSTDDDISESDDLLSEDENTFFDILPSEYEDKSEEEEDADNALRGQNAILQSDVDTHKMELERLKEKDPKFVKFLKKHKKEFLHFDCDDDNGNISEEKENIKEGVKSRKRGECNQKIPSPLPKKLVTAAQIDAWCEEIVEKQNMRALNCLLQAFQTACHYGDGEDYDFSSNIIITNSKVFNKILIFVLSEMDGIFRKFLGLPNVGGKREIIVEMQETAQWINFQRLIKSYFGSTLYLLNQMADNQIISFTLQCLRPSVVFLAAFPTYLQKILKVALQLWATGGKSLSSVSFMFIRDAAIFLGSDCADFCLKRIYKVFAANCKIVNAANLQQIDFLKNCVVELYGFDLANSYKQAYAFIERLGMVLQQALTLDTKEAMKKACGWQYINCLDLWVKYLCAYAKSIDLKSLSYAMTQIIIGVSCLVSTTCYAPLKVHCVKMLNTLSSASGTFIPVASLLFEVLECKELEKTSTSGVGTVCDFSTMLKVPKPMLKSRVFQEECMYSVLNHLTEHLAQWSHDIGFPELAFITLHHLQRFHDKTNFDRFQRQVKQLMDQIKCNVDYVTKKREEVSFSPKDHAAVFSFLQAEKENGLSMLATFYANLRHKGELRKASLQKDSKSAISTEGMTPMSHGNCGRDVKEVKEVSVNACSP